MFLLGVLAADIATTEKEESSYLWRQTPPE